MEELRKVKRSYSSLFIQNCCVIVVIIFIIY
jgi:hypothetical protein